MRHRKNFAKLGRSSAHRKALLRNLMQSLVLYEKIQTTLTKAKATQRVFDRLIVSARKKEGFNQIRYLKQIFFVEAPCKKVIEVMFKRFESRPSGFTRITKIGNRKGDDAKLVILELV